MSEEWTIDQNIIKIHVTGSFNVFVSICMYVTTHMWCYSTYTKLSTSVASPNSCCEEHAFYDVVPTCSYRNQKKTNVFFKWACFSDSLRDEHISYL